MSPEETEVLRALEPVATQEGSDGILVVLAIVGIVICLGFLLLKPRR